jgi:uncharacterized protein YcnI
MSIRKLVIAATTAAALAAPAAAGAHAVVSPIQPQGKTLTAARTSYVLRVPNERADTNTYRVSMFVPPVVQEGISVKKKPGWTIRLATKDTGKKDADGAAVLAIEKITWTALRGAEIEPKFFDDFDFRFQNPAAPQKTCFWVHQFYGTNATRKTKRGNTVFTRKPTETVKWTGPEDAATPASCVSFVSS